MDGLGQLGVAGPAVPGQLGEQGQVTGIQGLDRRARAGAFAAGGASRAACSGVRASVAPGQWLEPPRNTCSTECALIAAIRREAGSWRSSRSRRLRVSAGFTTQVISVPPDVSCTQDVSARRARASATPAAASGTHCSRTTQSDWPSRCESGRATTRTTPAACIRR